MVPYWAGLEIEKFGIKKLLFFYRATAEVLWRTRRPTAYLLLLGLFRSAPGKAASIIRVVSRESQAFWAGSPTKPIFSSDPKTISSRVNFQTARQECIKF